MDEKHSMIHRLYAWLIDGRTRQAERVVTAYVKTRLPERDPRG